MREIVRYGFWVPPDGRSRTDLDEALRFAEQAVELDTKVPTFDTLGGYTGLVANSASPRIPYL
jgi:hypothetical protein